MPKVKWDSGITASDIDDAELRQGFVPYSGPMPKAGVYRFRLSSMKVGVSSSDNPKLVSIWHLDGSWKPDHKKYDGCPLFDHMPVTKETAWRSKALCAALGVSSVDFTNKVVKDADDNVTKIGKLTIDGDVVVYANVRVQKATGEYDERLQLAGYLAQPDEDEDEDTDSDDNDDSDESTPF